MANNVFLRGLKENYQAIESKDQNAFYFTTDTRELWQGDKLYTESIRFYTNSLPTTPAQGVLYFNEATGIGSTYDGTSWKTVIEQLVSDDFVVDIASKSGSDGTLEITKGDSSKVDVPLTGVAYNPVYDIANLKLTLPVVGGESIVVDIPKDQFIESGEYDTQNKEIVLTMTQGGEVRIPADDLVDIYTSGSGVNDTITITISEGNEISASFKVDTNGALGIADDGKLTIDLSGYATSARVDAVEEAIDTLNGDAQTSGSVAEAITDAVAGITEITDELDSRLESVEESLTWGSF
jgi:hypothetical protein